MKRRSFLRAAAVAGGSVAATKNAAGEGRAAETDFRNVDWGPKAREILRRTIAPSKGHGTGARSVRALRLPPGPHLFVDWRMVKAGGFHWASKETGERLPLQVRDSRGRYTQENIDARMVPGDVPRGIRIVAQQARKSEPFPIAALPRHIIYEDGLYRAWFAGAASYNRDRSEERLAQKFRGTVSYAESKDGFDFGEQQECTFDWSAAPDVEATETPSVFLDLSAPASERYKLVFLGKSIQPEHEARRRNVLEKLLSSRPDAVDPTALSLGPDQRTPEIHFALYGGVSPDGIHWKILPVPLMIIRSDAQNVVYFDTVRRKYVWYLKANWFSGRRSVARAETEDFRSWSLPELLLYSGPDVHPSDDWYLSSKTLYPGTDDYHLMFPTLYRQADDTTQVRLFSSPDGVAWSQLGEGPVLSTGPSGSWDGGCIFAGLNLIPLPDDRVGLPYTGYLYPHKYPRNRATFVNRRFNAYAVWTRERLAALEAGESGSFATLPLLSPGRRLRLNVQTRVAGEVLVEVLGRAPDAPGEPLRGRSFSDCDPITGNHLDYVVTWNGKEDLGHEIDLPVTLRFRMKAAKLFALELV